jgi:Adh transcription factor 1
LRDTFIKYYRLELLYKTQESKKKQRYWTHFHELDFLRNHVDLFRLEDRVQRDNTSQNSQSNDVDTNKIILFDDVDQKEIYEILVSDEGGDEDYVVFKGEDNLLEPYVEKLDDGFDDVETEEKQQDIDPSNAYIETTATSSFENDQQNFVRNITDPDERYLMSCLPAFKRFNPQQKAYVRMAIERLFYEVEFENVSDPQNKRLRSD